MKWRPFEISIRVATIGAVIWAASGMALYAGFLFLGFSPTSCAVPPALTVACYLIQVRFIFCPNRASIIAAWLAAIATCALCAMGAIYDFVDPSEGAPGAYDWINNLSSGASAFLATCVVVLTFPKSRILRYSEPGHRALIAIVPRREAGR